MVKGAARCVPPEKDEQRGEPSGPPLSRSGKGSYSGLPPRRKTHNASLRDRRHDREPGPLEARLDSPAAMRQNDGIDDITAEDAVHGRESLSLGPQLVVIDFEEHRAIASQAIHVILTKWIDRWKMGHVMIGLKLCKGRSTTTGGKDRKPASQQVTKNQSVRERRAGKAQEGHDGMILVRDHTGTVVRGSTGTRARPLAAPSISTALDQA